MTAAFFFLAGMFWGCFGFAITLLAARVLRARRRYLAAVAEMKSDPAMRKIARDTRRKHEVKRMGLLVVQGGRRDRGPFALKTKGVA